MPIGLPPALLESKPLHSVLPVGLRPDLPILNPFASVDPMGLPRVLDTPTPLEPQGFSLVSVVGFPLCSGTIQLKVSSLQERPPLAPNQYPALF